MTILFGFPIEKFIESRCGKEQIAESSPQWTLALGTIFAGHNDGQSSGMQDVGGLSVYRGKGTVLGGLLGWAGAPGVTKSRPRDAWIRWTATAFILVQDRSDTLDRLGWTLKVVAGLEGVKGASGLASLDLSRS